MPGGDRIADTVEERPLADERLPAAAIAAVAGQTINMVIVICPTSPANPATAGQHSAVEDDAAADAYSGADIEYALGAPRHAEVAFAAARPYWLR